ncbi:hypothetical protein PR048_029193 [Dryococelus australis]|uniref:Uncharacterized protein n=1 Tax=Dryococelus australis TaxID=614101 RepID=A0ABQ9GFX3_9NEOP|nr:hypothetical protein PR048_029193 [Dryococelus australis]
MIYLDNQPISIIENTEFHQLTTQLEPKTLYQAEKLLHLKDVQFFGVTAMWTYTSNDDYVSIIVHRLDNNYKLQHLCLEVAPFT